MKGLLSFLDIIAILLIVFMAISALLAKHAGETNRMEYQTKIELLERALQDKNRSSNHEIGDTDMVLTITKDGQFISEGQHDAETITMASLAEVSRLLENSRPSRAYLRVDKAVPTGVTQEVLLLCQELGVLGFLAASNTGD